MAKPLTIRERNEILELAERGVSQREIARRIGRTHYAVRCVLDPSFAERNRQKAKKWREENEHEYKIYLMNYRRTKLARGECHVCGGRMGRTNDGVCQDCRRAEALRARRRLAELIRSGYTPTEVARILGKKPSTVRRQLVRLRQEGWDIPHSKSGPKTRNRGSKTVETGAKAP